eukprot:2444705-Amphidinium_carterae.1
MEGDQEPSPKKSRGMGSGTPSVPGTPTEIPSPASPPRSPPRPADASAGANTDAPPPDPATAEAAAVTEADIEDVLAQVDSGADWESAAKGRRGRPARPAVMPQGALDKYVVKPTA